MSINVNKLYSNGFPYIIIIMIIRGKVSKILPNDNNEISITTNNNSNAFEQNTSIYIRTLWPQDTYALQLTI